MKVDRYPIDFEALERGSLITANVIEKIVGAERGTEKYSLGKLRLAQEIQTYFLRERRLPLTVRHRRYSLEVLGDADQVTYSRDKRESCVRKMVEMQACLEHVDPGQLTSEERESHDRELRVSSLYLQHLKMARGSLLGDKKVKQVETKEQEG